MMRNALIFDTSILCVWLGVPGKATCGPDDDRWDRARVTARLEQAEHSGDTLLVLPLASVIETGNHIAQARTDRYRLASALSEIIRKAARPQPLGCLRQSAALWTPERLKTLADTWPDLAAQGISLADTTIKDAAEYSPRSSRGRSHRRPRLEGARADLGTARAAAASLMAVRRGRSGRTTLTS